MSILQNFFLADILCHSPGHSVSFTFYVGGMLVKCWCIVFPCQEIYHANLLWAMCHNKVKCKLFCSGSMSSKKFWQGSYLSSSLAWPATCCRWGKIWLNWSVFLNLVVRTCIGKLQKHLSIELINLEVWNLLKIN